MRTTHIGQGGGRDWLAIMLVPRIAIWSRRLVLPGLQRSCLVRQRAGARRPGYSFHHWHILSTGATSRMALASSILSILCETSQSPLAPSKKPAGLFVNWVAVI